MVVVGYTHNSVTEQRQFGFIVGHKVRWQAQIKPNYYVIIICKSMSKNRFFILKYNVLPTPMPFFFFFFFFFFLFFFFDYYYCNA